MNKGWVNGIFSAIVYLQMACKISESKAKQYLIISRNKISTHWKTKPIAMSDLSAQFIYRYHTIKNGPRLLDLDIQYQDTRMTAFKVRSKARLRL